MSDLVASSSSCLKRSMMAWLPASSGRMTFRRHHAIQFAVSGLVDRAHAAFAQNLQDFVALAQYSPGCSMEALL